MRIIKPVEFDPGEGSFARASTGTYFDKDGVLRTAAADEPRWNYTFEDGEWVGPELLAEGQRTNLLKYSEDFGNSAWQKAAACVVTPNTAMSPDGNLSADSIKSTGTSASDNRSQQFVTLAVTAGTVLTFSVWLRADSPVTTTLRLANQSDGDGENVLVTLTSTWARFTVTRVFTASTPAVRACINNQSAAVTVYAWGAQLEVGDRPSSYIPTTSTQVTRAADIPGRIITNVPENDAPVWEAGTYDQGTKRIQNHHVYEVLAESTTDAPADGVAKAVPTWLDLGVTNPWRAFDEKIGTVTSNPEAIRFSIRADQTINALAFFGVDAGSIRVTVTDPSLGRVFEHEATPVSTDGIDNWYEYLFAPIELVEDFVVLEVPAGTYGTIDISLDKPGGEAKLGALVLGQTSTLGVALYGTSIRLRDFSRKERDAFGNFVIQERDFSKVAEFDVAVDTANISAVQRTVAQYRAKPVVWIGEAAYESTIIYGFCTDFGVSISGPTISDATFSVEGLN